ncbi:uncharacterized protein LOC143286153 [Babylonia areolata]|uniref:uncharacterized protein LOC143286153 n=1 Tax=Babylonia areolata TaxID=304850 RepID=UPI003FD616D6
MNVTGFLSGCRVVDKQFEYLPWDNPDNIITLVTQVNAYKAGGILIPWLGMLGVPLNILNCIVYKRLGLQERVNLLLFALSCADLVVTACVFALYVEYFYMLLVGRFTVSSTVVNVATNTGLTVIPFGSAFISGFISTLIACERCLCISHPFKAKRILRTKTTAVILIVSVVIILGIHYVIALKYRIGCEYIPSLKVSLTVFYPSEFYQENAKFVDILNVTTFGLVLPPLFVLTTVIATVITVVKLKGAAQWRQSTATVPVESKEIALTKMLIAVSILFIVCSIPNLVVKIVPLFVDGIRLGGRAKIGPGDTVII